MRSENERLRSALAAAPTAATAGAAPVFAGLDAAGSNEPASLRKQVKEFTLNTQFELEKKLQVRLLYPVLALMSHVEQVVLRLSLTGHGK